MFRLNKNNQPKELTTGETMEQPSSPHQSQTSQPSPSEEVSSEDLSAEKASSDTAPDHFDDLIQGEETAEHVEQVAQASSTMMSKENFHTLFCGGFTAASHMTKLQSMAVDASDGGAIACTEALYDTILDIPALHFLLNPYNKWFERAIVIGSFTIPMAGAVGKEMKEKKAAKQSSKGQKQQSNTPTNSSLSLREQAAQQE